MLNTGTNIKPSTHGLLTTVAYKLGPKGECVYALEGAVAVCGSAVQWLRDQLKIIREAPETEKFAAKDNGGAYFVPAFSGLFAPRWDASARGIFCGLTAFNDKSHFIRATLESVAYQAREVIDAMGKDSGVSLKQIKVDGGMTANSLVMQFQSDIINTPVTRPQIAETTALGAAYAAGLAVGVWRDLAEVRSKWAVEKQWRPEMSDEKRTKYWKEWNKAVSKSINWEGEGSPEKGNGRGWTILGTIGLSVAAGALGWAIGTKKIKIN